MQMQNILSILSVNFSQSMENHSLFVTSLFVTNWSKERMDKKKYILYSYNFVCDKIFYKSKIKSSWIRTHYIG